MNKIVKYRLSWIEITLRRRKQVEISHLNDDLLLFDFGGGAEPGTAQVLSSDASGGHLEFGKTNLN